MGTLNFASQHLRFNQVIVTVNRETFIEFMDDLIPKIAKEKDTPTFIILDYTRIHHGFDDSITLGWMKTHNTFLGFIPSYSPELNMIEILWKHPKYYWRKFATWTKDTLRDHVKELLERFGTKIQINFS